MPRWCRGHSAGTSSACTPSDFPVSEGCVPKIPRTRFCDPFDWLGVWHSAGIGVPAPTRRPRLCTAFQQTPAFR
jgi:hypothetical protein